MIKLIIDMQTLEIREDIYERFIISKLKHKPHLSNEDFIQFLMTQFENCCSKVLCNGYRNGVTDNSNMDSQMLENTPNGKQIDSQMKENVALKDFPMRTTVNFQLSTCPECKFSSGNHREIEQHFNDCHNMSGAFPCTCGQCFGNLSQFLAHYIVCPIAATDLQQTGFNGELFDDDEEEEDGDDEEDISVQGDDKDNIDYQSREQSPLLADSDEQPLDFHINSPSFSNPLNLIKKENVLVLCKESPVTDYSINAMNFDNNHSSSSEKLHLPDHLNNNNTSSISASSPGNQDLSKRPGKVYDCEHCEKTFKSKGLLDQHKHLHFPPRHECEFCGRRFRWPPQFYTHKQQCSKRKLGVTSEVHNGNNPKRHSYNFSPTAAAYNHPESRVPQSGKMFPQVTEQCLCGFQSSILTDMYEHKRSCMTSARAMILQKIIDYKSIQTPQMLQNMPGVNGGSQLSTPSVHSVMQNFMSNNTNTAPYSGPDNGSLLQNLPQMTGTNGQVPRLQNDEKPFECDFCESRFMTKISLKQHLDGKHSDQAKYCCEKCGKGYFWNASYNYHKKKCTVKPALVDATATNLNH